MQLANNKISEDDIMKICLNSIDNCDVLIFSSMNGVIGRGIYQEIERMKFLNKPIYYIHNNKLYDFVGSYINIEIIIENENISNIVYANVYIK